MRLKIALISAIFFTKDYLPFWSTLIIAQIWIKTDNNETKRN